MKCLLVALITLVAVVGSGADASPDSGGDSVPGRLLDLREFKLTLPIGPPRKATEVEQPALATFAHETFFHLNADGTGVVFRAPCGGSTTKGSGYPRSELREMTDGGRRKAAWSTTNGRHRMFIRQAITHTPDRKPHVVAGQIHDGDEDVLVIRLEGRKLFVDHNGNDGPVLTDNYKLGDVFTVQMIAEAGRVRVYYNGAEEPVDDYPVRTNGCYFKAGCYTQSNPKKGDVSEAYGEVVVYELRVEHE